MAASRARRHICHLQTAKSQMGASRSNRRQQRIWPGCHEDKHRCARRLFERLEQRVLRRRTKRIRLLDDRDAAATFKRAVHRLVDGRTHLLDLDGSGFTWLESSAHRDTTPRTMRRHAGHSPHPSWRESSRSLMAGTQFSAWATATAVSRLPTPSGPEKIRLGVSVSRAIARESSVSSRRWPMTSRKGMIGRIVSRGLALRRHFVRFSPSFPHVHRLAWSRLLPALHRVSARATAPCTGRRRGRAGRSGASPNRSASEYPRHDQRNRRRHHASRQRGIHRSLRHQPARIAEITKIVGDDVKSGEMLVRFEFPSLRAQSAVNCRGGESRRSAASAGEARARRIRSLVVARRGFSARNG